MSRVQQAESFESCWLDFYRHKGFDEHYVECVRDVPDEHVNSLHYQQRVRLRGVSRSDELAVRREGSLDRCERARGGTVKVHLRYRNRSGQLLEGVYDTDGRSLLGITIYMVPELRLAA